MTGDTQRSISSTAVGMSDGSSSSLARCSGCSISASMAAGDQVARGLVAGDGEQQEEGVELRLGECLAVDLGLHERC